MADVVDVMFNLTPMLATQGNMAMLDQRLVFDEKVDGIRALGAYANRRWAMRNRNGRDITDDFPELDPGDFWRNKVGAVMFDGEIVSVTRSFEDTAWRARQKGHPVAMLKVPVEFVVFDVLTWDGVDYRGRIFNDRRNLLNSIHLPPRWSQVNSSRNGRQMWKAAQALGSEGVIAKNPFGRYDVGRSNTWAKIKRIDSVTCIVTGYTEGHGSRENLGSIELAMVTPSGTLHPVGSVGSGFTVTTANEMRERIDSLVGIDPLALLAAMPLVEVQTLGKTKSGLLRQPVYVGERSDITFLDCSIDQMETLSSS